MEAHLCSELPNLKEFGFGKIIIWAILDTSREGDGHTEMRKGRQKDRRRRPIEKQQIPEIRWVVILWRWLCCHFIATICIAVVIAVSGFDIAGVFCLMQRRYCYIQACLYMVPLSSVWFQDCMTSTSFAMQAYKGGANGKRGCLERVFTKVGQWCWFRDLKFLI